MKLPKWSEVYPAGTKAGDEEIKFFIALARNAKYEWRSVSNIAKESGLSLQRIEEIINKYLPQGIIIQSPKSDDYFGYWERVPEYLPKTYQSVAKSDQNKRLNDHLNKSAVNYLEGCTWRNPDTKETWCYQEGTWKLK